MSPQLERCIDNRSLPTLMDHDSDIALITFCKKLMAVMPGGWYVKFRHSALIPMRFIVNIHTVFVLDQ